MFGQGTYQLEIADLTAGLRYEHHSKYGDSTVPRAALTKMMGPYHAKLLYSQAFRVPVVQNINVNPGIKPEKATAWELETGYQASPYLSATLNFFDITIKNPIVFGSQDVNGVATESYFNFDRTGSRGVEAALRFSHPRGYAKASYAFYDAAGKNSVANYQVPGHSDALLGAPMHKGTLSTSVRTVGRLYVSPSAVLLGPRYAYINSDGSGNGTVGLTPTTFLLDLWLSYQNLGINGLDIGLGVHNILNEYNPFPQPYDSNPGGHPPTPGPSREYGLRVTYAFSTK